MSSQTKSILLVDDEQLNLDMLSRRLTRSGFNVQVALDGAQTLELVHQAEFDLVLMDHMMPGMSGPEVLAEIRKTWSPAELPVIMVTAVAESTRIAEALAAGANDYVTKPIDYQVALARIHVQMNRRDAEMALRVSEQRYALAAKASRDALWDWDFVKNVIYLSPRWAEMAGLAPDGVHASPETWLSRIFAPDRAGVEKCLNEVREGNRNTFNCDYRFLASDGDLRWMSSRGIVTHDAEGKAVRLSGSQSDVTEERTRDTLTGLYNRSSVVSRLEQLFLAAHATSEIQMESYAVLFLDLDGFKIVNDSLGHLAGDRLLCIVAERLRDAVAKLQSDRGTACRRVAIARMGGDEFAVLLESPAAFEHACILGGLVQEAVQSPTLLEDRTMHCVFSIGVAAGCAEHTTANEILNDADVAMYSAKAAGRGRMMAFTPDMRKAALERLELENDLCDALKEGQMRLVYQPKVRLDNGAMYGVEALLRWEHPCRGTVSPAVFIPIAEKTGAILEIGEWVLHTACTQVARWQQQYPLFQSLELSVNLSPREFLQSDLVNRIQRSLEQTGFQPPLLHLEVTEGILLENLDAARKTLLDLHRLGILLDLDDFGSGYSSLRYLRELPFDTLKIDGYFISTMDSNQASSMELIHAILSMAKALHLDVVAEGIETMPHTHALQKMGCLFGQGFYFSKPLAVPAMEDLMRQESTRQMPSNQERSTLRSHFGFALAEATS